MMLQQKTTVTTIVGGYLFRFKANYYQAVLVLDLDFLDPEPFIDVK